MTMVERVERLEAELIFRLSLLNERVRDRMGITAERIGGGIAVSMVNDPSGFWSKAQGFGFTEPVTKDLIGEVLDFYRAAGGPVANFHLAPEVLPANWAEICEVLGLVEGRPTLHKLVRDARPVQQVETSLRVGPIGPEDGEAWAAVQVEAFQMPDPDGRMVEMLASVNDLSGVTCYAAWDGDKLVATGALYVDGELGEFVSAATLPEYRGRGAQSALLARRVQDALAAGCTTLAVEVVKPARGEDNPSLNNVRRAGFEIAYDRPVWTWKA